MYEVIKADGSVEQFTDHRGQDIALRVEHDRGTLIVLEEVLVVACTPHVLAMYAPGTWNEVHWISETEELI
jgi:hypothetical protein